MTTHARNPHGPWIHLPRRTVFLTPSRRRLRLPTVRDLLVASLAVGLAIFVLDQALRAGRRAEQAPAVALVACHGGGHRMG